MLKPLILSLTVLVSGAAFADPPAARPETGTKTDVGAPFGPSARIAGDDLAVITGRADTAMAIRANNTSTVSNNSVVGTSQTGGISFDARAFANLSGLSLLSANTGNNVSINSSLNLNVAIQR